MDENSNENPEGLSDGAVASPCWRATIRGRRLTLTGWAPWLISGGPLGNLIAEREADGTTIVDLTVHGAEISVRFYAIGGPLDEVEDVLIEWAELTGYRRLWLPDRLVDLERDPEQIGTASVRCPTCCARWSDASPEFWLQTKAAGAFPRLCPMCGCELPQWSLSSTTAASEPAERLDSWRPSDKRSKSRPTTG